MIALVGLSAEAGAPAAECLADIPALPALRWSGFMVHSAIAGDRLPLWISDMRRLRPAAPIGVVVHDAEVAVALLEDGLSVRPVLRASDVPGYMLPARLLLEFMDSCVDGAVLDHWKTRFGPAFAADVLPTVAAIGTAGGGRQRVARHLVVSLSTLERCLARRGLPTSHELLGVRLASSL
jgi:hypothetical protein